MRSIAKPILVAFAMASLGAAPKRAADAQKTPTVAVPVANWASFRGDAAQRGRSAETVADELIVAWSASLGGEIKSSAAVDADRVYVGSGDGAIYALNRADGSIAWKVETGAAIEAPVALVGSLVVVGSTDGKVYAVQSATGSTAWTYDASDKVVGGVRHVADRDLLVFGAYNGTVHGISAKGGLQKWTYETGSYIYGTPAVAADRLVIGGCDGQVHSVAFDGGSPVTIPVEAYVGASVATDGKQGFVGHFGNAFMAFDVRSGDVQWTWSGAAFPILSSASVTQNQVIFGSRDRAVHGLNRQTGGSEWSFPTRGKVDSSPVIVGDKLLIGSNDGRLYMLEHETGLLVWSFDAAQPISATVAVYDGQVYVGSHDGTFYGFGPKTPGVEGEP